MYRAVDLYLPTSPIFQSPEMLDAFQASSSGRGLLLLFSVTGNLRGKSLGSRPARRIGGGKSRTRAARQRRRYRPRADEDDSWAKKDRESWGWPRDAGLMRRGEEDSGAGHDDWDVGVDKGWSAVGGGEHRQSIC